ncbi:MAG: hypothetical protein LBF89_12120 [Bacteroidales bacterium]|jgi:hypothetical protein|nr:hypothetical protein [Bacteroidales bacterium]
MLNVLILKTDNRDKSPIVRFDVADVGSPSALPAGQTQVMSVPLMFHRAV